MATALSEEKIKELWQAYQKHPSVYFVAAKCKVSPTTARKYRDSQHWEERLQKIRDKARTLADANAAEQLATDIQMIHDLKIQIATTIQKQLEAGNYKPTVRDYDSLVRLEQFLKGGPDSRTEESHVSFEWLLDEDSKD
jgi:2-succinyl-5-enolpyruvyl-6-hydroxy-3-cyclohexene-1-carboxylate synthase